MMNAREITRVVLVILGMGWVISWPATPQTEGLPDLVVERLVLSSPEPEPGIPVELTAIIANRGQEQVSERFLVAFEADGVRLATQPLLARLRPTAQAEVRLLWTPAEGEHLLRVRVDIFDEIAESNESNNTLETYVEVRKLEGVRSLTLALLSSIAHSLQQAGQTLHMEPSSDLFQLLGVFQSALDKASQAFSLNSTRISTLRQILPAPLAAETQMQIGEQIAQLYQSMATAFRKAFEGVRALYLPPLLSAFEVIQRDLTELSALAIEGISLAALSETAQWMSQGLAKAQQLQAAVNGASNIDLNAVAQDLLALVTQIGQRFFEVGAEVRTLGQQRAARFTDGGGQPIVRIQPAQELKISLPAAQKLQWEILTADGQLIATAAAEGPELIWKSVDAQGTPLPPGRYFYRLRSLINSGDVRVELGQIILDQ